LAKPRINQIDWYQKVIDSLSEGSKKPAEIEKDLEQKARQRYEHRYDLSEEIKSKLIKRETIKLRYIQYILDDLLDREIVAQEKPYGEYALTEKILEHPKFAASTFNRIATSKITHLNAPEGNPFVKVDDGNFNGCYIDAYSLFAFGNKIGALIVYAMLDAMNPDSMKRLAKGIEKDQFVQEKINNIIAPQKILEEFCKIEPVKRGKAVWNTLPISESLPREVQSKLLARQQKARLFDPSDPRWSRYEMDHETFEKAMLAFSHAYPGVFETLERVKKDLSTTIQGYRKSFVRSAKNGRATRKKST
jgi:hypothetical protein